MSDTKDWKSIYPAEYDPDFDYAKFTEKINKTKLEYRSDHTLEEWTKYDYYNRFPGKKEDATRWLESIDALYNGKPHPQATSDLSHLNYSDTVPKGNFQVNNLPTDKRWLNVVQSVPRVHCSELSVEDFREKYEIPNKPVIITGLTEGWNSKDWTWDTFKNLPYAQKSFRIGDDDDGRAVRIPFTDYIKYARNNKDDSPLYVFEDSFDEICPEMCNDYIVPKYFQEDIFPLLPIDRRPLFRWVLIGPERSGTRMHIDPLDSSAWNVVIAGIKRWVILSPALSKDLALGKHVWTMEEKQDGRSPQAVYWFDQILPRVRAYAQRHNRTHEFIEVLQYPGEVIFVPSLWHHAVCNHHGETISFTQNWVSNTNFSAAYRAMRTRRAHMTRRLLLRLKYFYPHLLTKAQEIDKEDKYQWKVKIVSKTAGLSAEERMELRKKALLMLQELDMKRFKEKTVDDEDMQEILDVFMSGDSDSSDDSDDESSDDDDDSDDDQYE